MFRCSEMLHVITLHCSAISTTVKHTLCRDKLKLGMGFRWKLKKFYVIVNRKTAVNTNGVMHIS